MFNDGYDLMEVHIPEGTLLKPREPAALSCRTHALGRIFDVLGLLGQGDPTSSQVRASLTVPLHVLGYDKNGEWYQLYSIGFGGIPGKPSGDGPMGLAVAQFAMCRTSSSRVTSPCVSKPTRQSRIAVVRATTAVVMAYVWATASWSLARSRFTMIAG